MAPRKNKKRTEEVEEVEEVDKDEQIRQLQEANELLAEQLAEAQASVANLTAENDLLSNDRKQMFKNLYTTNTNATNEIASIIAGMNSQCVADGHQHHILKLSSHPYFNRMPIKGGRSWSKAIDSDGRKTCCNVFYNSAELKEKCSNVAFQWCIECSVINFNTYYLCDECTRHGEVVLVR